MNKIIIQFGDYEDADYDCVYDMSVMLSRIGAQNIRTEASEEDCEAYIAFLLPSDKMGDLNKLLEDDGAWEIAYCKECKKN